MKTATRLLPAFALAAAVAVAAPACAQTYGYGRHYPDAGYAREIEHRAYERGYREGLEEGRNDARKGRNYAPSRHGEFRDADDGYNRRDGDREFYRRVYRRGFEVGYRESFDRNARYRDRDWRR